MLYRDGPGRVLIERHILGLMGCSHGVHARLAALDWDGSERAIGKGCGRKRRSRPKDRVRVSVPSIFLLASCLSLSHLGLRPWSVRSDMIKTHTLSHSRTTRIRWRGLLSRLPSVSTLSGIGLSEWHARCGGATFFFLLLSSSLSVPGPPPSPGTRLREGGSTYHSSGYM
jgi:hypothetical protein